jgi:AcrR family transcriptional regulator
MSTRASSPRRSAHERRAEIITAASRHFARFGYSAASTEAIARDSGISQPYLFRLFGTKKDLFLACHERMHEGIAQAFESAAEGLPVAARLPAMGKAYTLLLGDRDTVLLQMQSYAACADPDIQACVRARFGALVERVQELTQIGPAEAWEFFSTGMLLNVVASLDLAAIAPDHDWAARWTDVGSLMAELRGDDWRN